MKKKLLLCLVFMLLAGIVFFVKPALENRDSPTLEDLEKSWAEITEKILDKGIGRVSDNMIFIPFELVAKYKDKLIEIPSDSSEIGWVLFGLTEEGKQMKEIDIPAYIEGKPVICLYTGAFFRCPDLVSVTIPGTIRYTRNYAFSFCPKLKSITSSGDFFNAVGGVNSPIFAECNISEWNYSDGLDVEFTFAPWE